MSSTYEKITGRIDSLGNCKFNNSSHQYSNIVVATPQGKKSFRKVVAGGIVNNYINPNFTGDLYMKSMNGSMFIFAIAEANGDSVFDEQLLIDARKAANKQALTAFILLIASIPLSFVLIGIPVFFIAIYLLWKTFKIKKQLNPTPIRDYLSTNDFDLAGCVC